MPNRFQPGQRWISEGEPELGLGLVRSVSLRTVSMAFPAADAVREFALESAPLLRVAFRVGDSIRGVDAAASTVRAVTERAGLIYYDCGQRQLCETELSSTLSFSGPQDRFFAGRFDPSPVFDLRFAALKHQYRRRKSEVRGFMGGRIDLLPHQLSIAAEVTSRLLPRVLLADEVGLGKTIEACLILHRLLLTGRVQRVLILVPEALVPQWFLELLRRFNLWFHIYDEPRCKAIEKANPGANPFLEGQLLLCDLGLFTQQPQRLQQALAAGWDLLVVDEAHHLGWSPETVSAEYTVVETLGHQAAGLLLLTATPEQLGMVSHFARLRLLDPDRFFDLDAFLGEAEGYGDIARLAGKIKAARLLAPNEVEQLASILGEPEATIRAQLVGITQGDEAHRQAWMDRLLDQHGTGRVMFRNTRATIAGFTKRVPCLHPLEAASADAGRGVALAQEWLADSGGDPESSFLPQFERDPRIEWIAGWLQALPQEKALLICQSQRKAEAIHAALQRRTTTKMAVFHEGLSLVQRDRGAAWFADQRGARLLICSEIGSEGRNFQFAHHLILFDLPLDPALLEQRLGRLDRIGQTEPIQVHVPFLLGTHLEVLARWYQDGLAAFAEHQPSGGELLERFEPQLRQLVLALHEPRERFDLEVTRLLETVREARKEATLRLEQGRDRLLEWNSFRPDTAERLIHEIHQQDEDPTLEHFLLSVLDLLLIEVEELAPRTYQLGSAGVLVDAFPGLTSQGLTITCDRQRALGREELQFLTWDHPLATGALDLLLGSEQGNCSFARWPDAQMSCLYLEAIFLLEGIAPAPFHLDRFLPPTPLRILVNQRGLDASEALPHQQLSRQLKPGEGHSLVEQPALRDTLLPRLLRRTEELANQKAVGAIALARKAMNTQLEREITRLRDLRKVNRTVRDEEIAQLVQQQRALDEHIKGARLRLDALRLIHRGPVG